MRTTYLIDGDIYVERVRHTLLSKPDEKLKWSTEVRPVGRIYVRRYGGRTNFHLSLDEPPHVSLRDAIKELEDRVNYAEEVEAN